MRVDVSDIGIETHTVNISKCFSNGIYQLANNFTTGSVPSISQTLAYVELQQQAYLKVSFKN